MVSSPKKKLVLLLHALTMMAKSSREPLRTMEEKLTLMIWPLIFPKKQVSSLLILVIKSVKKCIGDVATFTDPEHLKHLKKKNIKEDMLGVYDLNHDEVITWGEYNIADNSISKELPYARIVFKFFDKNHDWKITAKELTRSRPDELASYIGSGGKRKRK